MKKILLSSIFLVFVMNFFAITHTVNAGSYYYLPSALTVNVNDTVVWVNDGGYHNVNFDINTITGMSFNNPVSFISVPTNGTAIYNYVFTVPGTYNYDCSVGSHAANGMVGTIIVNSVSLTPSDLTFTAIMDLTTPSAGNTGKAILLTANQTISDLSIYGFGSATNGGGSDGQEYTFPAISISAGQHIIVCRDSTALSNYFNGCLEQFAGALYPNLIIQNSSEPTGNGNDAYELFENGLVIETFGDITHTYGSNYPSIPWGYRDSWAWKDTAAANVGNWVFGGDNCTDGSTTIQTSNCPFPLCGSAPPIVTYNVTLEVNTASIYQNGGSVGPNGMYAGGGILGGANAIPLSDPDGDSIWTGVALIDSGTNGNYAFFNSPSNGNDWVTKEDLDGLPCAYGQFNDRSLPIINGDTILLHCFGTCDYDGTCNSIATPPTVVNITFQVDMSDVTDPFTAPELIGTFNGWCGNCNAMSDVDGDNVWDVIVSLTTGENVEYKYSADSLAIQEMNDPGAPCTNSDSTNSNRVLTVPASDSILGVVCWASCEPCIVVPPTGLNDRISNVKIYPNPANNVLNISSSEIIQKVEVLDVVGRVIISKTLNSSNYILDVSNLNSNVYFISYYINGVVNTKKMIVNS